MLLSYNVNVASANPNTHGDGNDNWREEVWNDLDEPMQPEEEVEGDDVVDSIL